MPTNNPYRENTEKLQENTTTKPLLCRLGYHKWALGSHRPYSRKAMFEVGCQRCRHYYIVGRDDFPDSFSFRMKPGKEIAKTFIREYQRRGFKVDF